MEVKKVKVELLVNTAYQGPRKEGDVIDVPEDFAKRWVKNGIAKYAGKTEAKAKEEPAAAPTEVDYSAMTAKELYALCKERGLEVEAKKGKEYYIEKLTQ